MKKFIFAAAVLAGLALAGCTKDNPVTQDDANARLVLKITNAASRDTRAVEAPGDETSGLLKDALLEEQSYIFVFNRLGNIVEEPVQIEAAALASPGQLLDFGVPSDAFVYVVANIPSSAVTAVTALTTLAAVQEYTSGIELQVGKFETPTMANVGGEAARIGLATEQEVEDEGTLLLASVTVQIKPVVSRLELAAIESKEAADALGTITAFDVTGVYVDDYFPTYYYDGLLHERTDTMKNGQSTTFTGWLAAMKDEGEWSADELVATAGEDVVWAYNVAPGGLPRLIIKLENVEYIPVDGDTAIPYPGTHYLTVTGYQGLAGNFAPGKVYRIGGAGKELVFGPENLWPMPNPVDVRLTVFVDVLDWVFEDYTPILAR